MQWLRLFRRTYCVAYVYVGYSAYGYNIAEMSFFNFYSFKAFIYIKLTYFNFLIFLRVMYINNYTVVVNMYGAVLYFVYVDSSNILIIVYCCYK